MEQKSDAVLFRKKPAALILLSTVLLVLVFWGARNILAEPYLSDLNNLHGSEGKLREDFVRIVVALFENDLGWNSEIKCFFLLSEFRFREYIKEEDGTSTSYTTVSCAFQPMLATRVVGSTMDRSGRGHLSGIRYLLEVDALQLATSEEELALLYLEHFTNERSLLDAAREQYGRSVNDLSRKEFLELMALVRYGELERYAEPHNSRESAAERRREYLAKVVRDFESRLKHVSAKRAE